MDLQFWIPIIGLGVAFYGAYLQRQQVKVMKASSSGRPAKPQWWQHPALYAMAVLAILTWVPFVVTTWRASTTRPPTLGVNGWGVVDAPNTVMMINVVILADDPANKLMGVALHYKGDTDVLDAKNIQRSGLYDIRKGNQILQIRGDDDFKAEVASGMHGTSYQLFAVPVTFDPTHFTTLRQVYAAGGRVIWGGVGPP